MRARCLKGKEQKEKGFIIGGCDTIITEKHGAESELSERCDDKAVGTGQRELSINLSLKKKALPKK